MKLAEYLAALRETQVDFSKRSGVPHRTVHRTCVDGWCGIRNAIKIVRATHARPTPSGGVVSFDDLARPKSGEAAA